ncbi:PAS domain S-box protein [Crenobacter cavernae]|uniref:histidine kinase n=1 Tax=Crenobacter cavernae TaxID=2290923 RepID=A0ABY0FD75_9NEIS|nr:PAS domain S-box protein [Crenobacter cavernae]RXZ44124.1 PAS domain S-box protein [Crenobacter cavernae]
MLVQLKHRANRLIIWFKRSVWSDLFPNSTVTLFFLTMAVMLWTLDTREADQLKGDLSRDSLWAEQSAQRRLDDDRQQLIDLSRAIGNGELDETAFRQKSAIWLANMPEMAAIAYADASGTVRYVQPMSVDLFRHGQPLPAHSADTFAKTRDGGRLNYSPAYPAENGEWFVELQVPVRLGDTFAGTVVGVFSAQRMVRRLPPSWLVEKYQLELVDTLGRTLARNAQRRQLISYNEVISLPGSGLFIRVRPVQGVAGPARKLQLGLIVGLTLLTLLSLVSLNSHIRRRIDAEGERDRVYRLSQDLLAVVDEDTSIVEVNPAFERVLGYLPGTLEGRSFLDFLPESEKKRVRDGFAALLAGTWQDHYVETPVIGADGVTRDIVWALSPLPERNRVYLSGRDISVEKQALEDLRRESAFRKAMEDSLSVGIRAMDRNGRITYVNQSFCTITGYGEDELVGQLPPYPFWLSGDAGERNRISLSQTLAGDAPTDVFESRFKRKNGEQFYAQMLISPLIDADGSHSGWVAALTDVTREREAEERYKEQMEKLQATSRLVTLGEMASTLAHELNQPLSAIANYQNGCIERIRQGKATPEKLLPVMEKVTAQAERAGMVVRRIREFVKQSAPDRRACQLAEVVDATLAIAEIEAKRHGARIAVDLPELPDLLVDPILIEQVLLNLIKNGIESMHEVPLTERVLSLAARLTSNKRVTVTIADRGHGVPEDQKERLFEAFFTTKPDGTGLGLGICRSIVEFHQGQIWVEDGEHGGSLFSFTLPVVPS